MADCPASYFHFLWYVSFLKVAFWLWSNGRAKVTKCEAVAAGKENQYNGGERQATSIKHGEMWETGKKEEDVIFWETRKWALCSSISIYGIRIVSITGDIWYWDEEICVRPFSFKPLSLHGLLLFKEATMEKEGFGKRKASAAAFPKLFFLCPSPKWVPPFMTLLSPFLPNSFSIQHSGLQPLISVCSPASISHTPLLSQREGES